MKQTDIIEELAELKTIFESVAAHEREGKFFQAWFNNEEKNAQLYDGFAEKVGQVRMALENKNDVPEAIQGLTELKMTFEDLANGYKQASFLSSWTENRKGKAEKFDGYARKTDAILKQVQALK